MPVAVVTDSTHYLPPELIAQHGIHTVSLYVKRGDVLERESELLGDLDDYYARLRTEADATTSQPSVGDFLECYEPLLHAGHDIVSIHLSGAISGTYGAALQAQAQLAERGLEGRIEVFDSSTVCGGLGLIVLAAASRARRGGTLNEVADHTRAARDQLRIWFCLDTLEYLRRGGRVGGAQAWIGGALKIKPILSLESQITPVERVRTAGRAFERMVEYARTLHAEGLDAWCVQHIQAVDDAQRLVDRGREIFGSEPRFVSEVGPVIGAHAGPGMLGVGGTSAAALDGYNRVTSTSVIRPAAQKPLVIVGATLSIAIAERSPGNSNRPPLRSSSTTRQGGRFAMHRTHRKRNIFIGLVAAMAVAAGAYAYWTQTGSGSGTAATGSGSAITVNQTSTVTNLSPGSTPQALSGTFTNPNPGSVQVASVTATLASITGGAGGTPACTIADYQINNPTTTTIGNGGLVAAGTGGTWSGPTIQMLDSATNQNACKGATVNISYTSA